jgi:hypothetical protein
LRGAIAFIFVLIAVPLMLLAACNFSISTTLVNEQTYLEVFNDDNIFRELLPLVMPAIVEGALAQERQPNNIDLPIDLQTLNNAMRMGGWRELAELLVPSSWLKQTLSDMLGAFLALVRGDARELDRTISFKELRQRLSGAEGQQAAEYILSRAETCTRTQSDLLETYNATGELTAGTRYPICNGNEAQNAQTLLFLRGWFATIGDSFVADERPVRDLIDPDIAQIIILSARIDRQIMVLFYLLPIALMAWVVIVAVRSLRAFGWWVGSASTLTATLIFLLIVGGQLLLLEGVGEVLNARPGVEQFFAQVFFSFLRALLSQASALLLLHTVVFGVLGFVLVVIATNQRRVLQLETGEMVVITDDGRIISTSSKRINKG